MKQLNLFDSDRMTDAEALRLTTSTLRDYMTGEKGCPHGYKHLAIAYSGGKDSTALVTLVIHLIETRQIPRPKSLTIVYADTRQELPPLHQSAMRLLREVENRTCTVRIRSRKHYKSKKQKKRKRRGRHLIRPWQLKSKRWGFNTKIAVAEIDKRFLVYMLGRGVTPPNNATFRWCTRQIKIDPMMAALDSVRQALPDGERLLMLTGVRLGESVVRDRRIALSCSKNGAECGQAHFQQGQGKPTGDGWFQWNTFDRTDTLAPILHWRVCHVWEWLINGEILHGFPTFAVADAYGGDEARENGARTGCMGCPVVQEDLALTRLIAQPKWSYLAPLGELKGIYREMRSFEYRLQKDGSQRRKDGSLPNNPNRKGPLTLEARLMFLDRILDIQQRVNEARGEMPEVNLLTSEEESRIRELIAAKTWLQGWDGTELLGSELIPQIDRQGNVQSLLW